jgi:hypothetical protein
MHKRKKNPKRLAINVSEEEHKEIKVRASFRGVTITDWLKIAISERIQEEKRRE